MLRAAKWWPALPESLVRSIIEAYSSKRPEMDTPTETNQLKDSKADVIAFKQTKKLLLRPLTLE